MKVNYVVKRGPELPEARWDLRAAGGVVQAAGPSVPRAHRPVGPRSCSPSAVMPDMTGKRRVEPPLSRLPPWGTAVTPVSRPAWGPLPPPEPPGSWNGPGWLTHAEWPWLSRCCEPSAFFPGRRAGCPGRQHGAPSPPGRHAGRPGRRHGSKMLPASRVRGDGTRTQRAAERESHSRWGQRLGSARHTGRSPSIFSARRCGLDAVEGKKNIKKHSPR